MSEEENVELLDEEMLEDGEDAAEEADPILDAFAASIADEADEDEVKMAMIAAGATFKNVTRLYNKYMIDAGLAISKADRNQIVEDTLEGLDFETEEQFEDATARLEAAIEGASTKQASSLVRAYAKKNELECYKKPKGEGTGRVGFASKYYDWLVANVPCSKEDATAFVMGTDGQEETSQNTQNHLSHYLNIWSLANTIGKAREEQQAA